MTDDNTLGTSNRVGYGCPPKHTRFARGRSGNPKGRPKDADYLQLVERLLQEKVEITIEGEKRKVSRMELAMRQLLNAGAKSDVRALNTLLPLMERISERREKDQARDREKILSRHEQNILKMLGIEGSFDAED